LSSRQNVINTAVELVCHLTTLIDIER